MARTRKVESDNAKTIRIEPVGLASLKSADRNPRGHNIEELVRAFTELGFNDPVAINEHTGKLLEGHGRTEALQWMRDNGYEPPTNIVLTEDGDWGVPTVRGLRFKEQHLAERYLLFHDRSVERGSWDEEMLAELLQEQIDTYEDDVLGWDLSDAQDIIAAASIIEGDLPEAAPTGDTGISLDEKLDNFVNGDMKQVVLYFEESEYTGLMTMLSSAMSKAGVDNHSEAVMAALKNYA